MADSKWYWYVFSIAPFLIVGASLTERLYGVQPWTLTDWDLKQAVIIISVLLEIGNWWHLSAWRSSTQISATAVAWVAAACIPFTFIPIWASTIALSAWGIRGGLTSFAFPWFMPDDMAPIGKAIVILCLLLSVTMFWRFRLWAAARADEGYSGWQTTTVALRNVPQTIIGKGARLHLFADGILGVLFGAFALLLLFFEVSPVSLAAQHRWGYFIGFLVGVGFLGSVTLSGLRNLFEFFRSQRSLPTDTHGLARWARFSELLHAKLAPQRNNIYLGHFVNPVRPKQILDSIEYPGAVHMVTVGRTGSGKGTGLIIPNLSMLRRSIVIIDPKGEAAAITARKRATFGRVVMLNPFELLAVDRPWMKSEGLNPLLSVRRDENFVDDCTIVAQALVKQERGANGRFFSGSAHDLVTALIMHEILSNNGTPSLANVRTMLTAPWGTDENKMPIGISRTIAQMTSSPFAPLRSKAGRFMASTNSTRDIISTAVNETSFIDSPQISRDLSSGSNFRFSDMKKEIVTVFLVLPATHLESHSNWLRLMIATALRELMATPASTTMPPCLFMLDEFAQLSHLPLIANAMNIARSFGVQLWPFVQDLTQLKDTYADSWENFLGASAALTAFAPRDVFSSEYLSKLCANRTIIVERESGRDGSESMSRSRGPEGSPLIRPDELRAMPPNQMLCIIDPVRNPFLVRAPGYWTTQFAGGLDKNPYFAG